MIVSREKLHQLVWSTPITHVAAQLGVSDSYLARVCESLGVPRPPRGHWAKLAVGKAQQVIPLPDPKPGQLREWSKGTALPERPRQAKSPGVPVPSRRSRRNERLAIHSTHALISGARAHFEKTRAMNDDGYLRPFKKNLVDIITSVSSLARALALFNDLFNTLESAGYAVLLAQQNPMRRIEHETREVPSRRPESSLYGRWRPGLPTIVCVDGISIGLSLIEMSEEITLRYIDGKYIRDSDYKPPKRMTWPDHSWTTVRDMPSGRFRLVAYCAHALVSWSTSWQDTDRSTLVEQLPTITRAMKDISADLKARLAQAEEDDARHRREWEIEQDRLSRQRDRALIVNARNESIKQLEQIMQVWVRRNTQEAFFAGIIANAEHLPPEERAQIQERLETARQACGTIDPLAYFRDWKTPGERYQPQYHHELDPLGNEVIT